MGGDPNQLGPFVLLEKLGEGGMGVVYKARDTRLDRLVAIKLLPESRIADPDRRARFMLEARAASALNHPNIVTIHDIAEEGGRHYIVMEFVDGKPLSDLIPPKGMPVREVLRLAVQIGDALAAAHAAGIVHRDLKPGNIMVDPAGRPKVLDFGLAKLVTAGAASEAGDDTVTVAMTPRTEAGAIVGSVPYMSPEQAEGRSLDARSDIFSFGAVLYEMITGQRAFPGETRISTLAAIVEREPRAISASLPNVPAELERIVSRCLRKEVARRSQNMTDVRVALEELRDESTTAAPKWAGANRRRWLWPAVAAACAVIAAVAVVWRRGDAPAPPAQLVRVSPDDGHSYMWPAISPDGKFVAMVSERSGSAQVWLQQIAGGDPIQITHSTAPVRSAQFFPDGTRLLTWTRNPDRTSTLEVIPTLGGQSRVLVSGQVTVPAISPDGKQVAYIDVNWKENRLLVIPSAGGIPRSIGKWAQTQAQLKDLVVDWMPDSRTLLVSGSTRKNAPGLDEWDWFALPIDGGDPVPMGAGELLRKAGFGISFGMAVGDRLVFAGIRNDRTNIFYLRYSPGTWKVQGSPRQLSFGTENELPSSFSTSGMLAVQSMRDYSDLFLMPVDPATGQISGLARRMTQDGKLKISWQVGGDPGKYYFTVLNRAARGPARDGYSTDLATSESALLSGGMDFDVQAVVSLDGRQIAYARADGDSYSISVGTSGAAKETLRELCTKCGLAVRFSPDGKHIVLTPEMGQQPDPKRKLSASLLEVSTGKITPLLSDPLDSLTIAGFFATDWAIVRKVRPGDGKPAEYFAAQWRDGALPRTEWIKFALPLPVWNYSPSLPYIYGFKDQTFMAIRFDPKRRLFSEAFPVKMLSGDPAAVKPTDAWTVRGPGITFTRRQTTGSVWLMKLPE